MRTIRLFFDVVTGFAIFIAVLVALTWVLREKNKNKERKDDE